jgi:aminoglycoside phosphotransferase
MPLVNFSGLNGVWVACLVGGALVALLLLLTGRLGHWPDRPGGRSLLSAIDQVPLTLRRAWSRREIQRRLAPALKACGLAPTAEHRLLTSDSDALVVALECRPRALVVKIATSPAATAGLDRHAELLGWLRPALGAGPSAARLPQVMRRGRYRGERVLVETRLPGTATTEPSDGHGLDPRITAAALAAIAEIHQSTAASAILDPAVLRDWVDEPLGYLRRLPAWAATPAALDRLANTLHDSLTGRQVTAAVVHGDFWSGNVLVRSTGAGPEVTGIVDWENALRVGLPDTDLVYWWLADQPVELGTAVRHALDSPGWADVQLAALPVARPNPQVPVEDAVLLTWLGHVGAGLARATRNPLSTMWVARNIRPVAQRFAASATGRRAAKAA